LFITICKKTLHPAFNQLLLSLNKAISKTPG